jgi:Zn-dependent M32 family carboxypeptidase
MMNKPVTFILMTLWLFTLTTPAWSETGFTQKDRELLIELKTRMDGIDKRFEGQREDINKRFEELREDMNKRFEQVDKRFEQMDKRFEQMMSFTWILATIFGAIVAVTIGFAVWDRRTMIRPFETKVAELDKRITVNRSDYETLISVLKEYSETNKKFANIIHRFNLF